MSKPVFEDTFSFSGRRNRRSYFLYSLSLLGLIVTIGLLVAIVGFAAGDSAYMLAAVISLLPLFVIGYSNLAVTSQRCRDFGWTGWTVLILLIPYLNILASVAVMVIPGEVGPNRYGDDPLGSTT